MYPWNLLESTNVEVVFFQPAFVHRVKKFDFVTNKLVTNKPVSF